MIFMFKFVKFVVWSGLYIFLVVYRYDWSNKLYVGIIFLIICGR